MVERLFVALIMALLAQIAIFWQVCQDKFYILLIEAICLTILVSCCWRISLSCHTFIEQNHYLWVPLLGAINTQMFNIFFCNARSWLTPCLLFQLVNKSINYVYSLDFSEFVRIEGMLLHLHKNLILTKEFSICGLNYKCFEAFSISFGGFLNIQTHTHTYIHFLSLSLKIADLWQSKQHIPFLRFFQ